MKKRKVTFLLLNYNRLFVRTPTPLPLISPKVCFKNM